MTTVNATVNITANNANANGNTANGKITANNANPIVNIANMTATAPNTPPRNNFAAGDDDSNRTNRSHPACQKTIHKDAKNKKREARHQRLNRPLQFGQASEIGTGF